MTKQTQDALTGEGFSPTYWSPVEIAALKLLRDDRVSYREIAEAMEKTFGKKRSEAALGSAFALYFGGRRSFLDSRGELRLKQARRVATVRLARTKLGMVEPGDPVVLPMATGNHEHRQIPKAPPTKIKVQQGSDSKATLIEVISPTATVVVETKRTLGDILGWLIGQ